MTSDITDDDLTRWELMCQQATSGPWVTIGSRDVYTAVIAEGVATIGMDFASDVDAELTAESRTALPRLIAEIRRLRAAAQLSAAESIRIISEPK